MKQLVVISFIFLVQYGVQAQNNVSLLLDGLPSGAVYTDSTGYFSTTNPDFQIAFFTIVNGANGEALLRGVNNADGSVSKVIRSLPSKTRVVVVARVNGTNGIVLQLSAEYFAP